MDFHRIPVEFLRDKIIKGMIDKGFVKDEYSFDDIVSHFPFDLTDQPIDDNDNDNNDVSCISNEVEVFSDNIDDDNDISNDDSNDISNDVSNDINDDNESDTSQKKDKKKKVKKEKKENKDKSDKPSKPASSFVFFKSHPDNQSAIEEASKEINEDTGKPYGKVKGAGIVWGKMTDEEKKVWADKSLDDFNSKNQEMETAS